MALIKSGIENPSKSEVIIGRCGGDENPRMITQNRPKSYAKKKKKEEERIVFNQRTISIICFRLKSKKTTIDTLVLCHTHLKDR